MKLLKKIIGVCIASLCVFAAPSPIVTAYQWGLPGIDIISRDDRGAEKTWMYRESGVFDNVLIKNAAYDAWLAGEGPDLGGFEQKKHNQQIQAARNSFLVRKYPEDIAVDTTISYEDGKSLVWPFGLVKNKRKIILHHTADSLSYETPEDGKRAIQEFYELHTLKRGRGDIGYNFLIDPFGQIYEGRAGGRGVVGAHADWNNASTIGIALMGNFDVHHPSDKALSSLMRLMTVLAFQYRITPYKTVPYFTAIADDPYLEVTYHDSVVGHKDAKNTACPGEHLYERIPYLKSQLNQRLVWLLSQGVSTLDATVFVAPQHTFTQSDSQGIAWINTFGEGDATCQQFSGDNALQSCTVVGDKIVFSFVKGGDGSSGYSSLGVYQGGAVRFVDISLVWEEDVQRVLQQKIADFSAKNGAPVIDARKKSQDLIDIQRARSALKEDISVLLYEATTSLQKRQITCEGTCTAYIDGEQTPFVGSVSLKRDSESGGLLFTSSAGQRSIQQFSIATQGGLIRIVNYGDPNASIPVNLFRGKITIEKGWYTHLENGVLHDIVVVNTVPFDDYLMGIGESSEAQHVEKTRVLAVLAKQYALWYAAGGNRHPSVPLQAAYKAIDDPRLFQKYIGAGAEGTRPVREKALKDTQSFFVSYNGTLPILPYFHCSAGFTRSGREVFGWTDTPWLASKLDVTTCENGGFEGHGVGLSGDGAQELALQGRTFDQILRYYYTGVTIVQ